MPVTIDFYGEAATLDGGEWTADNKGLAGLLNAMTAGLVPSASSPSRGLADKSVAMEIVELLGEGAKITAEDLPDPDEVFEEGIVY